MADTKPQGPDALAATIQEAPASDAPFARGAAVGHFIVLESIGSGAMGSVLLAYDPALDRKVALKLLRPGAWSASATTEGKQRLVREAQAMAKLSHPNVVTAYEVGTVGDRVFLAMEYVAGRTLGAWLAERPRTWREVVEVFLQAGRGLAAAHAAKIVHRDFKPENVLISSDGRVRVGDFGLASMVGPPPGDDGAAPVRARADDDGEPSRASGPSSLTRVGALIGTPAYMSPEQHRGEIADARADQFAFAVALYEALDGERPFAGATYREYADNVLAGRLREGSKAPVWIRRILARALAVDPAARFASMDDLLAALASDPAARRRRWLVAAGFGGIVLAAASSVLWLSGRKVELCAPSPHSMAGVWDAPRRADLERAFLATKRQGAADTAARVARILDERSARLVGMRADACRATHVRGEQSPELLDLRIACLDRETTELRHLVAVFTREPDAVVVDNAVEAALSVAKVDACADAKALTAAVPLPADNASRIAIALAREKLAHVEALATTGKYKEGAELIDAAVAEAEKVGWAPLLADALNQRALMESRTGKAKESEATWRRVLPLAAEAKDDRLLAHTWINLLQTVGYVQLRHEEAAVLEEIARVQVKRAGDTPWLVADLNNALGGSRIATGDYTAAVEMFEKVREARIAALGPDHPAVASAIGNLASVVGGTGDLPRQLALNEEALAIRERVLGPDHPHTAGSLHNLAIALHELGRDDEAQAALERAVAVREKVYGPDSLPVGESAGSLALVLKDKGKVDEALAMQSKALAIKEKAFGADHPNITSALNNLANIYNDKGDHPKARVLRERVLDIREKKLGPDHPETASALNNLSITLKNQGDFDGARKLLDRALAIREKRLGPDHPDVAAAMNNIAFLELERDRLDEADRWYRKALPILEAKLGPNHGRVLDTLVYFAETQAQRKNHKEAVALWQRALDGFAAHHPDKLTDKGRQAIEEAMAKARAKLPRGQR